MSGTPFGSQLYSDVVELVDDAVDNVAWTT